MARGTRSVEGKISGRYKVVVDDNFHHMRPEERYELGTFSTFEEAVAACKRIVDDDLTEWAKRPSTAKDLYETYVCFGEDPFIVALDPNDKAPNFFSWDYAKERSQALAAQSNM